MPDIIFVNPPLTYQERYGVRFKAGGSTPPFGLACLAAVTRQAGIATQILDASALELSYEQAAKIILRANPSIVGFTAVTMSISKAAKIASIIKSENRNIITLIGGPHVSALPEDTMIKFPYFDFGFVGESENTIIDLIKDIKILNYEPIKGNIIIESKERIRDLDNLPLPAWDLLPPLNKYYNPPVHTVKQLPAGLIVGSRGCTGKCIFCDRGVFGNQVSYYSPRYLLNMVKDLYFNYGIREIQFRDDNFLLFRRRLIDFCLLLIQDRLTFHGFTWTCSGRVDMIDSDILQLMKVAGCWQIWYGIESGSDRILGVINKDITVNQIRKAIETTNKAGIQACGYFIIGHPTETKEDIEATIKLSQELPLWDAHFGYMTPLPGSYLYKRASEYGTFNNDWDKLTGWTPQFITDGLTVNELIQLSKKAFRGFYFRRRIIWNYVKKLKNIKLALLYLKGFLGLLNYLIKKN